MTREEIEQFVGAEVDRRLGGMVGQIGKDLEDRYTTKDDVEKAIETRIQQEGQALNLMLLDLASRFKKEEKIPDTHPLAVVVQIMEKMADLEFRVLELGMYIVADNLEITHGTAKQAMKIRILKRFVSDREHGRMYDLLDKAETTEPETHALISGFAEVLGPRPRPEE